MGLSDTDARVVNMTNYSADFNLNGIDGIGANLEIEVYTKGSSWWTVVEAAVVEVNNG